MEAKDTRIYMIVDTENINQGNEDKHVEFKDDRDNKNPVKDPRNFTSVINPRKKVFWFGEPKDQQQDTIEIKGIQRKDSNDPEFLKNNGTDPSHRGAYMADVAEGFKDGEESSYNVLFEIKGRKGQYSVDPKLLMKV